MEKIDKEDIIALGFQLNDTKTTKQWDDFIYEFQRYDGDDADEGWFDGYKHYTEIIFRTNCNFLLIKKHTVGGFTGNQHNVYPIYSAICKTLEQLKRALEETSIIGSFDYNKK